MGLTVALAATAAVRCRTAAFTAASAFSASSAMDDGNVDAEDVRRGVVGNLGGALTPRPSLAVSLRSLLWPRFESGTRSLFSPRFERAPAEAVAFAVLRVILRRGI